MDPTLSYHHGHLPEKLIDLGLDALEREGAERLSLRSLAQSAGVSKTAPYRHFKDKDAFLGALADEGFRLLCMALERVEGGPDRVARMGVSYMAFAVTHPALYRLMNSPLVCELPAGSTPWARRSLILLSRALDEAPGPATSGTGPNGSGSPGAAPGAVPVAPSVAPGIDVNGAAAAWGYIHGLVLLRIDGLFPRDLPEPDWDALAALAPTLPAHR